MEITIHGTDLSARTPNDDQMGRISIQTAAFDGEVGMSTVVVPDPTNADNYHTGNSVLVEESGVALLNGWIYNRDRGRGPTPVTDIEHIYSVQDANALLYAPRIISSRPLETDVSRVSAFVSLYLPGVDTTYLIDDNHVTMPAKKYRGEGFDELLQDLLDLTPKTLFIHTKTNGDPCFHYHLLTEGHTAGITISDAAPQSGTNYQPGTPVRSTDGSLLTTDLRVDDNFGRSVGVTFPAGVDLYDADGLVHQKLTSVDIKQTDDILQVARNILAEVETEHNTYSCDIGPLDATALSQIGPGYQVTCTSQVWGLTGSVQRVSHFTLTPWVTGQGTAPGLWKATLELDRPYRRGLRGRGLPKPQDSNPNTYPYDPNNTGSDSCGITDSFDRTETVQWGTATYGQVWTKDSTGTDRTVNLSVDTVEGKYDLTGVGTSTETGPIMSLPISPNHALPTSVYFKARLEGVGTSSKNFNHIVRIGGDLVEFVDAGVVEGNKTVVVVNSDGISHQFFTTDVNADYVTGYEVRLIIGTNDLQAKVWRLGGTEPGSYTTLTRSVPISAPSSLFETFTQNSYTNPGPTILPFQFFLSNLDITDVNSCAPADPLPGRPVGPEAHVGDGSTTTFTLNFPYVPLSTKVWVAGLRKFIPNDYTESNPGAGDITFTSAPANLAEIWVEYIAV